MNETKQTDPAAEAAGVDPGEGYRWVKKYENLEQGDEQKINGIWTATAHFGRAFTPTESDIFRRRIPAPESVSDIYNCPEVAGGSKMPDFLKRTAPESVAKRFDSTGRDVTGLYGLHDESDTVVPVVEQEASTGYYIDGKEVTKLELYQHVGAKVFDGLRKGTLPGCNTEVMGLREEVAELRKQLAEGKEKVDRQRAYIIDLCNQLAALKDTPAAQVEEWRELSKNDVYSGPGQVRLTDGARWQDAWIVGVEEQGAIVPFVARITADYFAGYSCFRQARVKKEVNQ